MEKSQQFSLFEDEDESENEKTFSCPQNSGAHHWWDSRNTSLCSEAKDCSHCYIQDMLTLRQKNEVQHRCNVHYCIHDKTNQQKPNGNMCFNHVCEITGNKWTTKAWRTGEDYEKHPLYSPCSFCDLKTCDNCAFKKDVSEDNPYGCCGSCGHRIYCPKSKFNDASKLSVSEFLESAEMKAEIKEPKEMWCDLSKGVNKKTYSSKCPLYDGYIYSDGTFTICKRTDKKIKPDIFRCVCQKSFEDCPIYKEYKKGAETNA